MAPRRKPLKNAYGITWPADTELVGLCFTVQPVQAQTVRAAYTTALHGWFLDQVRQHDPKLSQRLHDEPSEKAFTLSGLNGQFVESGDRIPLHPSQTYHWTLTAFSRDVVYWLGRWLAQLPEEIGLRQAPLKILTVEVALEPTTYAALARLSAPRHRTLSLSFVAPTSFRRKGSHFPLPVPMNLFHSYVRRWNDFAGERLDADGFLDWVDEGAIVQRVSIQSQKVAAGKGKGSVTGFVGAVALGLDHRAQENSEFVDWFYRLGQYAPYCGTGHKTTQGLGQTRLGWQLPAEQETRVSRVEALEERIAALTETFFAQRQRRGGKRALRASRTWAQILARREQGESLGVIAVSLGMKQDTVNRYAKLARRALREG